jgi:hypothetical protein
VIAFNGRDDLVASPLMAAPRFALAAGNASGFSFSEGNRRHRCARRLRRECMQFTTDAANARSSVRDHSAAFGRQR